MHSGNEKVKPLQTLKFSIVVLHDHTEMVSPDQNVIAVQALKSCIELLQLNTAINLDYQNVVAVQTLKSSLTKEKFKITISKPLQAGLWKNLKLLSTSQTMEKLKVTTLKSSPTMEKFKVNTLKSSRTMEKFKVNITMFLATIRQVFLPVQLECSNSNKTMSKQTSVFHCNMHSGNLLWKKSKLVSICKSSSNQPHVTQCCRWISKVTLLAHRTT